MTSDHQVHAYARLWPWLQRIHLLAYEIGPCLICKIFMDNNSNKSIREVDIQNGNFGKHYYLKNSMLVIGSKYTTALYSSNN